MLGFQNWFTPEQSIYSFQSIKRNWFDRVCGDPVLRQAGHLYLDKQTDFALMLVRNSIDLGSHSVDCFTKIWFPRTREANKDSGTETVC